MSKALILVLRTTILIAAVVTSTMPTLFTPTDVYPSDVYASYDQSDDGDNTVDSDVSEDDDEAEMLRRQGAFNCAISIDPIVLHGDDPLPSTKIVPTGGSLASAGFFDVSYPAPDGHNEQVSVGDTLVLYLYFRNTTNNSDEEPCLSGGPVTLNISDITILKGGLPMTLNAFGSMVWPGAAGTLLAGEDTYGLIPFDVEITDDAFNITARITYTCSGAAYCSGTFSKPISYPSPDIRTLGGVRYFDVYGRNPIIDVVGPRAEVIVTSPSTGQVVAPYSVVRYVIELTSFSTQAADDIVSITDVQGANTSIPQCRADAFTNPQVPYGWHEDPNGSERVDSSNLTGANGPDGPPPAAVGALGNQEKLYCVFDVIMDPAIIDDAVNSSFTLNGTLLISNGFQTTEIEVSAPPVVILEASVSVSKTIVDPANPLDGVAIGGTVRYRITITNTGQTNLDAISIVDSLVGPIPYSGGTLAPSATFSLQVPYTVEFNDPSPLVNTVSVLAHPEGAPGNYFVEDTSATSIAIQGSELSVELKVFSVTPAGNPMAGSVLTYRVEYCNNSAGQFSNLQYVTGFPSLYDGTRPSPHYVDAGILDSGFNPGCFETVGTEFTYAVPNITDPDYSDPVFNTIRVRAIDSTGAVKYAEFTLVTNLVSNEVEISAYRYNIDDPGTPLTDSDAALRGETIYYRFDVMNKTATNLCGVQIRHYIRNSQGLLVNGNPYIIPNNLITWSSGIDGQLNADPGPGHTAFGTISFLVDSGTPDPLNRIFEVYAPQDCVNPLPEPFIDRAGVTTDISDIQVNTVISVFSSLDPTQQPLAFGFRTQGLQYQFNYSATNVGGPFMISSLQYCIFDDGGGCTNQNFPSTPPDFVGGSFDFASFETRTDQSDIIGGASGLTGGEPTPLQILVTLEAVDQNSKSVTIRTLYSFPLLTAELPGGIIAGDEELVRGDTPVPYTYSFINETNGLLRNVKVFNLLETSPTASPGFYEAIGVPGFPAGTFYEVCQTHGDVVDNGAINGQCNLTYHDGLPSGSFQMQVLVVGERASDGQKLITIGIIEVIEIPHLVLEKLGPGTTTTTSNVDWTITVTNQSDYQHVDFSSPSGFQDVVTPDPPAGSFTAPSLADAAWSGLIPQGGGVYRLPSNGTAIYTPLTMTAPLPDGFGQTSFTNTVTLTGSTTPVTPDPSFVSRQVSETAENIVNFKCPIGLLGTFIDNPDPFANTNSDITVGETERVLLSYWNLSSSTMTITALTDTIFERENGRPLTFGDITWPNPGSPGVLGPGEFAYYETIITIRPIDFPNPEPTRTFSWDALIALANAPSGCDLFEVEWFFDIVNPVLIDKQVRAGFDSIIFPGEEVRYQIALQNRSEHAAMQVTALNDNILELDSSPLRMDFDNGATYVPSGRLNPLGGTDGAILTEDGVQDSHIVTPTDPPTLINTATVHFYVINEPGNGPANMEKGPSFPMSNIDDATVSTANPLELIITPSTFDAAAGSIIDVTVQVTNTSVDFSITNIVITSGDTELTTGLAAAGYVPPIASLAPVNSQSFTLTNPHYQIPTDYSAATLSICAQATGTLQQSPPIDLEPVLRCATINIQPPDLEVVKEVYSENTCTIQLPDDDGDDIHEATIGARVYYGITISNNSTTQTFSNITISDTTNDGGNLTTLVQSAFEAGNGGSTSLSPGSSVPICVEYLVTSTALGQPVLTNTVVVNAIDTGIPLTVEDEVSVDVVDANIRISKTALPIVGFPGSIIEYTITITNRNPDNNWLILDDVWDTLIADRLPTNPSYHDTCVAINAPPNFTGCNPSITSIPFSDPNWTWPWTTPGVIPPDVNQPAIYTYTYEIQDTDPDPLINTAGVLAHIYSLPNPSDPSVGPWTIVEDTSVPPAPIIAFDETIAAVAVTNSQLLVRKTATPTTALVGTTVRYNIGITNIGDRPVANLRVFDCNPYTTPCNTSLPLDDPGFGGQELTNSIVPLSARTSLPPFTPTAVINTYSLVMPANADLQPGGSCEGCDPFINTIYAQGEVVVDGSGTTLSTLPGSDTAIVDLIVPGLRVTKTPSVGSAGIGATVQYTIEVFNTGDQPLRINSVTDIVPGTSTWTPLTTMSPGACTNPSTFVISPTSADRLQPEESLCAVVSVVVENTSGTTSFTEFVNTVRVEATADPGGLNTTIIDSASAEIDVRNLGLTVTKLAYCIASALDPACTSRRTITQVDEGKMYEYEITIVNTSTTPLRELRISDPDLNGGAITQITDFTGVGDGSALFDPGETYTFIYTHTASILDDIGTGGGNAYTNIVTVSAIEENGDLVQPRTASHTIVFVPAQVEVTKVGCIGTDTVPPDFSTCVVATPFAQPGDFIWYQVTIANPSNIAIDTITVTDSIEGVLNNTSNSGQAVIWPGVEGTLPGCTAPFAPPTCPQAVFVYRGSNAVSAADGSITNTAVVNGVSGAANITANDSTTVYVTTSDLLVTIIEDNNRTQATTGTGLTFTVSITNIGTDTINNITVLLPFLNGATPLVAPFNLTGGQSLVITPAPTYTVTNADGVMDFEVIANGLAVGTLPVSDTDLWSVTRVTPGLSVTKLADRSIARIGDTITYTFIVENTSTTTAVNNLVVSDPLVTFPSMWPPGLSPSQSATQQVTYVVTGAEGNPITNTVTVTGTVAGSPIAAFASVDVSVPNGDLLVENTPNVASANVGDTVSFTYRICNLSTTDDMTNVQLSDDDGALTLPSTTLTANACFTVVRDITLTDFDVPELFRTVTGSGSLPAGDFTQSVTSSVTVVPASAGDIRLEVQPSSAIAQIGSTLDLTFIITNVSTSTPLTITNFVDGTPWYTNFSINPIGEVLNPGEILVFTGQTLAAGGTGGIPITVTTPDPLTGTWTVTVQDPTNSVFSHDDSISVPIVNPGATLSVSVTSFPQNAVPGGTVTYTYRVQNLSAAVANNVTLNYLAQPVGNNCLVYTPGPEGLWTPSGVSIAPSGQAIATAVCEVDTAQVGGTTVDHTIEVLDGTSLVQDTAVIQTLVNVPLGIEIIGSDPTVWRVENPVTITYRLFNASTATTVTNITHSISNPTPCEDVQYFDAAVGGNSVTFNGTLDPLAEIFVTCTHDPVEAQPTGQITVRANAEGLAEGSTVVATAEQVFDVVELGLTIELTGAPDNGARRSVVDEGERVNFTLLLENTGQTDLILPPATEDPVTSRVYNANTPTSVLGTLGDLHTYLENECVWPLAPSDTCQIGFNDTFVNPPDLTFTPLAIHPSLMQATVEVMLWDALNNVPIMQTSTWDIEVQRPSISIISLSVSPTTPMVGTEVLITAIIQNDGFSTLENVSAVVNLNEVVAYVPQNGIVLTSGHNQSSILNSVPMDVVDTVLVPGEQTRATIAWDVDRAGQFRVQVITRADNTVAGASLTTVQDNFETTFSSIADPNVPTTDPDGNPLDPDALDPTIVKSAEPQAAFPNQEITFTITITNGSTSGMGNISFVDAVPDAFTVVSASSTAGASIVSGQLVTATTGQLGPGERVTITIVTTVAPDVDIPSLWTNEACANVEGRDPVCATVEVGVGTDAAILPTTGFGEPAEQQQDDMQKQLPVPEGLSEEPVAQGIPGAAGVIPLLGMGLMMLSMSQSNRQRWMIGGAAVAIVGTMALGLLVLSDDGDDGSVADAPTLTPALSIPTAQPAATLVRRTGGEATATLPPSETPQVPPDLPFPPTIRPSPTPYILPTASGPRRLEIPKLNLTRPVPIVELPQIDNTWDVSQLGHNVGWLEHTTWLDPTWGNTVIVGHVQLDADDPGPFYHLGSLVPGDEIIIWEGDDRYVYEVSATEIVHSTAIQVTYPTSDPILTLLTCTNWDFDRGVFADRLIIRAVPIERPTG